MLTCLKNIGNVLLQPLFPVARGNKTSRDGQIASKLFLSHVFGAFIVFFGVFSGEKAVASSVFIGKWTVLTLCIFMGLLAATSLLVTTCRQRSRTPLNAADEDPSINLQLVFLWVFALCMMISLSVNILIYMRCALYKSEDFAHSVFLGLIHILYILFTVSQISLLTYNKGLMLKATIHLHFSVVCILAANFSLWYSSTVHTLLAKGGNKTTRFHPNRSCFHSSEIQQDLGSKLAKILFPPQLEFYVLASTLLISLWQNSRKTYNNETSIHRSSTIQYGDEYSRQTSIRMNGKQVLALTVGISINIPVVISAVLLDFVYEWNSISAIVSLDLSETLSSLCSCVLAYMCCNRMKSTTTYTPRPLLVREYILILSSTAIMAFFMIGLLASVTGYTLSKTTILSRVLGMLETFLQTYLLLYSSRRVARESRQETNIISFCALILVISNLTYWLLDSYNKHIITKSRYIGYSQWDAVEVLLLPVVTFYRFFAGMSAYSMYKVFKPYA